MEEFDTPGTQLDLTKWTTEFWTPTDNPSFLGRTQLRNWVDASQVGPFVVANGTAQLRLDTFDPASGSWLFGTHTKTIQSFQPSANSSYELTVRMKLTALQRGIVYGLYFFGCDPGQCATHHDELDIEILTNFLQPGQPYRVQLNRYANEPLGAGHGPVVALPAGFDPLAFHTWKIRWAVGRVTYYVDDIELYSATDFVPQGPMRANVIAWAPAADWADAYDASLQASATDQGVHYTALVDSVHVVELSTVPTAPHASAVSPASGSGQGGTFAYAASDANGATDIASVQTLVNDALTGSGGCWIYFHRGSNQLWLRNAVNSAWLGPVTLGSAGPLSNGLCAVNPAASFTTVAGTGLTVHLALTFEPGFAGSKTQFAIAYDTAGTTSGWQALGSWTASAGANVLPHMTSALPASGSGQTATFAYTASDGNGALDIASVQTLVGAVLSGSGSCWTYYHRGSNQLWLRDAANSAWLGPVTLGSAGSLSNGLCAVNPAASFASVAGTVLTVHLAHTFEPGFAGSKTQFAIVYDTAGATSGWQALGSWTVGAGGNVPPQVTSVSPLSGSGQTGIFAYTASDANAATDITSLQTLVGATLSGGGGCWTYYQRSTNQLWLRDAANSAWLGPVTLGSAGSLSNGLCMVNAATSFASVSATTLTLNLAHTFEPGFAGSKTQFGIAYDTAGTTGGWQALGSWVVR